LWRNPLTTVSNVVAASSAFPPVLSPHRFAPSGTFDESTVGVNGDAVFRRELWLSDGGVYDNMGLETAWKRYRTILVSDGGGQLGPESKPKKNWAQHGIRVANIADGQVRALRKRQLISGYQLGLRDGTYWGIRSEIGDYELVDPMILDATTIERASSVPTRLAALDDTTQKALINWGYVIADTAMRKWVDREQPRPDRLPV
jgi:NTE family protein